VRAGKGSHARSVSFCPPEPVIPRESPWEQARKGHKSRSPAHEVCRLPQDTRDKSGYPVASAAGLLPPGADGKGYPRHPGAPPFLRPALGRPGARPAGGTVDLRSDTALCVNADWLCVGLPGSVGACPCLGLPARVNRPLLTGRAAFADGSLTMISRGLRFGWNAAAAAALPVLRKRAPSSAVRLGRSMV
jgi:hypothetical protein